LQPLNTISNSIQASAGVQNVADCFTPGFIGFPGHVNNQLTGNRAILPEVTISKKALGVFVFILFSYQQTE
jgi:hypothetical protein